MVSSKGSKKKTAPKPSSVKPKIKRPTTSSGGNPNKIPVAPKKKKVYTVNDVLGSPSKRKTWTDVDKLNKEIFNENFLVKSP